MGHLFRARFILAFVMSVGALAPVFAISQPASACVTCTTSIVCNSKGCHVVETCTYQGGECKL